MASYDDLRERINSVIDELACDAEEEWRRVVDARPRVRAVTNQELCDISAARGRAFAYSRVVDLLQDALTDEPNAARTTRTRGEK